MKRAYIKMAVIMLSLACVACGDLKGEYPDLLGRIESLENRVAKLEELCKENNTNISSLQTIVAALEQNDCVTSVVPITKNGEEIGYVITFAKHDPITIYHGKDGNDGVTPIIGVVEDVDGVYYWTINGEWLLNDLGQKMRVTGENGIAGTTPQLKIENDDWYISYDNGTTWTLVGQAKGDKGDSMFQSVTYDDDYVYFTLIDGTVLVVNRKNYLPNVTIVDGAIRAPFMVSAAKKVYFSQGNLQYQASTNTWRFAEHQYDTIRSLNNNISETYDGWIDMFGWGTSGWNSGSTTYYQPWSSSNTSNYYSDLNLSISNKTDWGYNAISNGGNVTGKWRTLSREEWTYFTDHCRYGNALVAGIEGTIFLPGNYLLPSEITFTEGDENGWNTNVYDALEWQVMEDYGAVFLPADGNRKGTTAGIHVGEGGYYWSSAADGYTDKAYYYGTWSKGTPNIGQSYVKSQGFSVRLVQDVE